MKAAVLREFKKPLTIEEVSQPRPGAGEVLIRIEACGVCHSDLHVADGDWSQFAKIVKTPLILGHEIAGVVVEKGAAVQDLQIGDRVGVPWIHWTCGECEFCREGNENLCRRQKITGVTVDGGYAEFVKAPASHALRIPDSLSFVQAAPLFCAGVTVYRALKRAAILPGQRLAVFGIGGLGHLACAVRAGAGSGGGGDRHLRGEAGTCKIVRRLCHAQCCYHNVIKEMRAIGRGSRVAGDFGGASIL